MQIVERITAEEFFALPETNLPVQLLDGMVIELTAPELDHQDVVGNTFLVLKAAARQLGGKAYVAPVDVQFDKDNVPQPDVLLLLPNTRCKAVGRKRLSGPPDLIVEVLSPGTADIDRGKKFNLYQKYGVLEYWIADPVQRHVEVWQHRGGKFALLGEFTEHEVFTSPLIGSVDCEELFAPN